MHLREAILTKLKHRAFKGTDLAIEVVSLMHPSSFSGGELTDILDRMVADGEILEIEYILPHAPNQIKSVYFPKGTVLTVNTSKWGVR